MPAAGELRFFVFRRDGSYHWVLHRSHDGIVATGGYPCRTADECHAAIDCVRRAAREARVVVTDAESATRQVQ